MWLIDVAIQFAQSGVGQALIIAVITATTAKIFAPRGKLVWAVSHQHHYRMPNLGDGSTFPVVTQQVWFQNVGRSSIRDIEIVLNWKPQHFEIWEPRMWNSATLPDGRFSILVPSLYRGEFFTLSMIDTISEVPHVINVRWDGGVGYRVPMGPSRILPSWARYALFSLIFSGIVGILYLLLQMVLLLLGR